MNFQNISKIRLKIFLILVVVSIVFHPYQLHRSGNNPTMYRHIMEIVNETYQNLHNHKDIPQKLKMEKYYSCFFVFLV